MWQGFQRGFTSDADCHATSFNECGPHAKTHVCYKQLNGVTRFVPFWFIMYGFAPSKLRVPKLSILKITVAIFAPSPFGISILKKNSLRWVTGYLGKCFKILKKVEMVSLVRHMKVLIE